MIIKIINPRSEICGQLQITPATSGCSRIYLANLSVTCKLAESNGHQSGGTENRCVILGIRDPAVVRNKESDIVKLGFFAYTFFFSFFFVSHGPIIQSGLSTSWLMIRRHIYLALQVTLIAEPFRGKESSCKFRKQLYELGCLLSVCLINIIGPVSQNQSRVEFVSPQIFLDSFL